MLEGETYVLEAVRDTLRTKLGLRPEQCDCEYDEQVPSMAGDFYVAVIGAGFDLGPKHSASGGVHDVLHSVQVLVLNRAITARDKRRTIFLERLQGINYQIGRVVRAIDWQMDLMSYANALMYKDYPTYQPFITSLHQTRCDAKPRMVNSEIYAGATGGGGPGTTNYVAMGRSIYFGGMRRMQTIAQLAPGVTV